MDKLRKLPFLLNAGAAGLLMAAQVAAQNPEPAQDDAAQQASAQQADLAQGQDQYQQSSQQDQAQQEQGSAGNLNVNEWPQNFQSVDANNNGTAEWGEIESTYEKQLNAADMTRENAEQRFDRNGDSRIDEAEYFFFINGLNADLPAEEKAAFRAPPQEQDESAEVVDKTLVNSSGDELGYIQDLVTEQETDQRALVVQLNDRDKSVLLNVDEVKVEEDRLVWQKDQGGDALAELPEYDEQSYLSSR